MFRLCTNALHTKVSLGQSFKVTYLDLDSGRIAELRISTSNLLGYIHNAAKCHSYHGPKEALVDTTSISGHGAVKLLAILQA
jgi:hypothetical protein